MATGKSTSRSSARKSSGIGKFFLGFFFALVLVVAGVWSWVHYGNFPVAVKDAAFPLERQIVAAPLHARIDREMKQPPFGISEDVYEIGAHIYRQQCAACHGTPGHDVPYAKWMYPKPPQLWKKHASNNVVGVSDDKAGETFWKVKNGIRLSGMPSFQHVLSNDEMWDVTLLLKNADQQLPDPVVAILKGK